MYGPTRARITHFIIRVLFYTFAAVLFHSLTEKTVRKRLRADVRRITSFSEYKTAGLFASRAPNVVWRYLFYNVRLSKTKIIGIMYGIRCMTPRCLVLTIGRTKRCNYRALAVFPCSVLL